MDDEISDFVDDPHLINVAVSRAKKQLILIVSGNMQPAEKNISQLLAYIQYHNFEIQKSKVYSIFDYLYKQYAEARQAYLKHYQRVSEYDSENLMYALISDVLGQERFSYLDVVCHFPLRMVIRDFQGLSDRECAYVLNPATHLDFLIFERMSHRPALAIEIDGYAFHQTGSVQAGRDEMKDHVLSAYDIPLLRFSTNGSGEKQRLVDQLMKLL